MYTLTAAQIKYLKVVFENRTARLQWIVDQIESGKVKPEDADDLRKEAQEHVRFIQRYKDSLRRYYRPATVTA